jgi:hypothetical protein
MIKHAKIIDVDKIDAVKEEHAFEWIVVIVHNKLSVAIKLIAISAVQNVMKSLRIS